ncbi:hypothetical protein B0H17DRAFT_1151208 [Mycena rosella]|uniref:Uncharacterized protein n=1 Tax=Mycena rosella TaxID=1033263 RepID=A0AAD7BME8_MYCRO|nr:hypothetical protein B0H17DRAFT_1151208 [Mycena rosella]
MTTIDHDEPWLMPILTAVTPDLWNTPTGHITNGRNMIPDINMGDVEGTCNECHNNNYHAAAEHLNSQTYYDTINSQHIQSDRHQDTRQCLIPENWEEMNLQIRQRHKPPKLSRSAKFTRSNVTIASQNINGRDQNKSMTSTGHKLTYMKRMVDEKRIGVFALQELHMNNIAASQFNNIYGKWFKLFNSGHQTKPDSTAGVGFLLNKKYVDTENVKSDHNLIPVQLTCRADEEYWNLPIYLLKTPKFINYISIRSKKLVEELEELSRTGWQSQKNIQSLWHKFKIDLNAEGKKYSRLVTERSRQIRTWTVQKHLILNDAYMPTEDKHLAIFYEGKVESYLKEELTVRRPSPKLGTTLRVKV